MTYELFLDDQGQKISKSKGNGLTIDEWLSYAATESLSYFMYQKPKTAKRMHFDVIPRAVDEYHQQLRAFPEQPLDQQVNNPVWHIHNGKPPASKMVVSFGMLLNLASVAGAKDAGALWKFIRRYAPEASPETHPDLDAAAGFAVRYFTDRIAPTRVFRLPTEKERAAMEDLMARLRVWDGATGRRGAAEHGLCRGQGPRVRAAARLVQGAVRGSSGRQRRAALRRVHRALWRGGDAGPDGTRVEG